MKMSCNLSYINRLATLLWKEEEGFSSAPLSDRQTLMGLRQFTERKETSSDALLNLIRLPKAGGPEQPPQSSSS